jgi:enoyl-CoA hydratase
MATLQATQPSATQAQAAEARVRGETLSIEWPLPGVMLVTFERAAERNALSLAMIDELEQALAITQNAHATALILTGSGPAFCAGADLKMLGGPESEFFNSPMALRDKFLAPLARLFDSFEEMPFPIIAAVNGFALGGGCEMALSADFRILSKAAVLGMPEVQIGAIPGAGGVQKLIRHVGRSKALEWILLGSRITAEEAERRGLVYEIAEPEQLLDRAKALAEKLIACGPLALAQAKTSIYIAEDADLKTARRFGVEALTSLAATPEWKEGVTAFVEKRKPRFR